MIGSEKMKAVTTAVQNPGLMSSRLLGLKAKSTTPESASRIIVYFEINPRPSTAPAMSQVFKLCSWLHKRHKSQVKHIHAAASGASGTIKMPPIVKIGAKR